MVTHPLFRWLDLLYNFIIKIGSNLQSFFLLYMRVTWGHRIFLLGLHGFEGATGLLEIVCGALFFAGLATRLIAIPLIILSLSTLSAKSLASLEFLTEPASLLSQRPYPYLFAALLVFVFGPGRISLDAWIKRQLDKHVRY